MLRYAIVIGSMLALANSASGGEPWTNFRGPTDQGQCDSANLPTTWSESENIAPPG